MSTFHKKENVLLNCNFENNELFKGNLNFKSNKSHFNILQTIELLNKCREISKFYNVNPLLKSFSQLKRNSRNIEIFYSIMKTGSYNENCNKFNGELKIHFNDDYQNRIKIDFLLFNIITI